jgi:Tfp pilus assembly protein PilN
MDEIHALQSTTQSLLADKSYIEAYLNTLRSSSLVLKELAKSVDPKSSTLLFDLAHSLLTDARDTAKKIGSSSKVISVV